MGRAFAGAFVLLLAISAGSRADAPYAPSRDYSLKNIRTHLWFDLTGHSIRGEAAESVVVLRDGVSELAFDSVDLKIASVEVDGRAALFKVLPAKLVVSLAHPAARGERHEVVIRYSGRPKKGLYFILPDSYYPQQPQEIWSQGEAEDTHYYIPLYDYPNDRTTSEMLLTVPASWVTISNGKLAGIEDAPGGLKTWDWKQSEPLSTYLISVVAGDFAEQTGTWRGIPLRFLAPRGREADLAPTFARTQQMLDLFSSTLGVPYPWAQYAQSAVDEFVAGGMENTSATTIEARFLVDPRLAAEDRIGTDDILSHELAHQWFGDLVTCKDWSNLWLNEGFATFFEHYWMEKHYGADAAAYEYWTDQQRWFTQPRLYPVPIFNRNFGTDSTEYAGDIYDKAGWVLRMLREKLGDPDFFAGLRHYLEVNRGKNVVTADLQKGIEEATAIDVDQFFHQWIYRGGAPQFQVGYTYDPAARTVRLDVAQTQKVEGLVELFDVPLRVEITTVGSRQTYPIEISQASQTFTLPSDGPPLMVLFDPGDTILKKVDFPKEPEAWIYQLKHAASVADRTDAAVALGNDRKDPQAIAALGDAAQGDPFWGVRVEALKALGRTGGASAEGSILAATQSGPPWVRDVAVEELGNFKEDSSLAGRLNDLAAHDSAYRVRASALRALGRIRSRESYDTLVAALNQDSPDDLLRRAALEGLGSLGDSRAVPLLLSWSAPGKPFSSRRAAITAVARIDKKDSSITRTLVGYLQEPYFDVRFSAVLALEARGDPSAIGPLESMLHSDDLTVGMRPYIEAALALLRVRQKG